MGGKAPIIPTLPLLGESKRGGAPLFFFPLPLPGEGG